MTCLLLHLPSHSLQGVIEKSVGLNDCGMGGYFAEQDLGFPFWTPPLYPCI